MASENAGELSGPDLATGVTEAELVEGTPLLGHAHGEAVMLVRTGDAVFAVGATCTHYGGPLSEGLVAGETVTCPWHHACFNLRTGAVDVARGAPALNAVTCFRVERAGGQVQVREKHVPPPAAPSTSAGPASVVIVGAGAAGHRAAETLRDRGYAGPITLVGRDPEVPYDRPNLSKDYLAGTAPEEWMSLRSRELYEARDIRLETASEVVALDVAARTVTLGDGRTLPFGALVLSTGADPIPLGVPGGDRDNVHLLRTLEDCRRLKAALGGARRVVIVGAGFIGLEAAASLRARGLEVAVVAPEPTPLVRVVGLEVGGFLRRLHEEHGVEFHLGQSVAEVTATGVRTVAGVEIAADVILVGIGVRPSVELARRAGLEVDGGIVVDEHLETRVRGIYAAGDVVRFPDARSGQRIRVEHWVVAQRMGAQVARNVLGERAPFRDVPFFWTVHYDVTLSYVGHAEGTDDIHVEGSLEARDCAIEYRHGGRLAAVLTIGRDRASLLAEQRLREAVGREAV